eukprot:5853984-Amphidinium_carterae.1
MPARVAGCTRCCGVLTTQQGSDTAGVKAIHDQMINVVILRAAERERLGIAATTTSKKRRVVPEQQGWAPAHRISRKRP